MAVYTDITDAELEAFLAEFDLGQAVAFKGIAEGVSNSNFMLETTGRALHPDHLREAGPRRGPALFPRPDALAGPSAAFQSPTPTADRDGEVLKRLCGKPAALVELPGRRLGQAPQRLPTAARPARAWPALHKAGRGLSGHRRNDLGHDALGAMFAADRDGRRPPAARAWPRRSTGDLALLAKALAARPAARA